MNPIFAIEEFVYRVDFEGYKPSEDEVKKMGELLGQPTKKLDVFMNRYWQVFKNYIEKKCASEGNISICIYTWKANTPFRLFPAALHAFGTVILFEGEKPVKVLAYPMNKALSYNKSPGLSPEEYGDKVPREVSLRVDGWQVTAYYNPLINRWVFATRYVLHNMYYVKGRLVVEPLDSIANPYVSIADAIAEKTGLYEKLDKYRGWTFTFVLEGPEPAVTRPPYPIGARVEDYKLYLLMARDPEGKLYTWSESRKLVDYSTPALVEPRRLRDIYEEARRRLDVRSYFAYIDTGDPENPVIVELESDYYPDAMNAKYLNDAKSAGVLLCEGLVEDLVKILNEQQVARVLKIEEYRRELEGLLARSLSTLSADEVAEILVKSLRELNIREVSRGELAKALSEGNVKRVVKKAIALLLEGKSLVSDEPVMVLKNFVNTVKSVASTIK